VIALCVEPLLGRAGDVEQDFWLAFDLLQNPKDHAEFTIVRNWLQAQLMVWKADPRSFRCAAAQSWM
jgi:hypothetical protein